MSLAPAVARKGDNGADMTAAAAMLPCFRALTWQTLQGPVRTQPRKLSTRSRKKSSPRRK